MSAPLYAPTTETVGEGWLRVAVPDVPAGLELPSATSVLATGGFIRLAAIGGSPDRDVPVRAPVIAAECWIAPASATQKASWRRAHQLASRVLMASYDPALMGVALDLSGLGSYGPARVHTVTVLAEPRRVDLEDDWARVDVDLLMKWTAG